MGDLTADETKQLLSLLKKLQPGFYPIELFWEFARLNVMSIIELVPLRLKEGKVEVLLLPRADNDPFWPGQLHSPGTVLRPTDQPETPMARIIHDELQDVALSQPQFVENLFHYAGRGTEQAQIYWVEVLEEPKQGTFYAIDALPDNLVANQHDYLDRVFTDFKRAKGVL